MSDQLPPRDEPATNTNIQPGLPTIVPRPVETIAYQPVSGWAVAGLGTSGFFAALVLISTIVALFQGAPIFFPVWFLSVAVVGIVLSLVGQNHVQNSEGTRTGGKLATIGVWLGVVSGLCYFSYYYATRYAQETQANSFLMTIGPDAGFFPLLQKSGTDRFALNEAFLLTRPFTARSGNPNDPKSMALNNDSPGKEGAGKGELSHFKESIMPRILFKKLGEEAEIMPLAVQEWKYEKKSYQISRIYSVKTKEIDVEMLLTVASTEAEASGQGRKWFLNLRESGAMKKTLTRYGEGVAALRGRAREWFEQQWLTQLNEGNSFNAIKDVDQSRWDEITLQNQKWQDLRTSVYQLFESTKKDRFRGNFNVLTTAQDIGFWEVVDGKIRIYLHFQSKLMKDTNPLVQASENNGYVIVETRQVIDPAQFDFTSRPPDWTLVGIAYTHSYPPSQGGMGGPMP